MSGHSIRTRLTAAYLLALALAMAAVGGGSYGLMRWSLTSAADASLTARVQGIRGFLTSSDGQLGDEHLLDEFGEFTELTRGETLIDVVDDRGVVLHRPVVDGWSDLLDAAGAGAGRGVRDARLAGAPVRLITTTIALPAHQYRIVVAFPMRASQEALVRFGWLLLGLMPVVGLVAGAGGYWISRRALAPVDAITRAARAITVEQLDTRLAVPGPDDELRRLTITFNDMLARLEAAVADMARLTAEAAHELRTPVTVVRTTAELAIARDRPAAEYRQALVDTLRQAERLSDLVGDLLVLARADAGVDLAETTGVDLATLVGAAVDATRPAAEARGLTLTVTADPVPLVVDGQEGSLHRLVVILLDNAVKYSHAGGRIDVAVTPGGTTAARLTVTDTGTGLDPRDRDRVFDRFFRGANVRGTTEGSGLGLAIARTIVARHGGTIRLDAGPAGVGCAATVELPLGSHPLERAS